MRPLAPPRPVVVELGGGDSCFFDRVDAELRPREYHVVNNNELGLQRLRRRLGPRSDVRLHLHDVLKIGSPGITDDVLKIGSPGAGDDVWKPDLPLAADVVFSVGLIEHFDPEGTRRRGGRPFRLAQAGRDRRDQLPHADAAVSPGADGGGVGRGMDLSRRAAAAVRRGRRRRRAARPAPFPPHPLADRLHAMPRRLAKARGISVAGDCPDFRGARDAARNLRNVAAKMGLSPSAP